MSKFRIWLGNGDHPDINNHKIEESPGLTAFFPTLEAQELAPARAEFIAAVASSPRPGSDIRSGFFIAQSPTKVWRWVLWEFKYDANWETWSWLVRATTDEPFKSSNDAAANLLEAIWKWERKTWDSSLFEEVEDTGLLDEETIWAIGQRTLSKN